MPQKMFALVLWVVILPLLTTPSPVSALEGSLTIQGGFADAFRFDGQGVNPSSGPLGYGYADINFTPWLSFGLGTGLTALSQGSGRIYIDETDFVGRISPWAKADWSPYLMGGAGFRPFSELDPDHRWWAGNFGAFAGVGVRHPLVPGVDLDVTAYMDVDSPAGSPLGSAGMRAGFSFPFGNDDSSNQQTQKTHSVTAQTATSSATRTYSVQDGDSLWTISKRQDGVGHDWQKIYDANKDSIKNPSVIFPQQKLVIPNTVNQAQTP